MESLLDKVPLELRSAGRRGSEVCPNLGKNAIEVECKGLGEFEEVIVSMAKGARGRGRGAET